MLPEVGEQYSHEWVAASYDKPVSALRQIGRNLSRLKTLLQPAALDVGCGIAFGSMWIA
jgi:hypothetical protein